MSEHNGWKTLQIIPAQVGWKAVHCQESENRQIVIFNRAIVCWALAEGIGESNAMRRQVRGIEQEANQLVVVEDLITRERIGEDDIDRNQYFLGYDDPQAHKESDYWIKQATSRLKIEREERSKKRID
jgi:hypothetical protein